MKFCPKCKSNKQDDEFFASKTSSDGLQSYCKLCKKEYQKLPQSRLSKLKYKLTELGRQAAKRYKKGVAGKQASKRYEQGEAGRAAAKRHREKLEAKEYHREYQTQDHIVPLSKGGTHTKDNVIPACGSCNSSKGNRSLIHWMAKKIGFANV